MTSPLDTNAVLAQITSAMAGEFQISVLLDRVVQQSMETLGAEVCSIFLEDPRDATALVMRAGSGFSRPLVNKARYRIGEGFTGTVARTGRTFNIRSREELQNLVVDGKRVWEGKFDATQWQGGHNEFRSLLARPLKIKDHILGVIKVENKLPRHGLHFSADDETYFATIANVVALVIENARLHQSIERQLKTIAAMAAHRIGNLATDYDGIHLDLKDQTIAPTPNRQTLNALVERIRQTTQSLKTLVSDITKFGKPLVIAPVPTDVNKVVEDEMWHARPPSWLKIKPLLDANLPRIPLDPRFAETLKELIRNAVKAIGRDEGAIRIRTSTVTDERSRECVRVEIEDTGPGFPPDLSVFEPFVSTDPASTGLGLATVKEFVVAHGGLVDADNIKPCGARVVLTLPCLRRGA